MAETTKKRTYTKKAKAEPVIEEAPAVETAQEAEAAPVVEETAAAPAEEAAPATFTAEQVQDMIAKAVAEALAGAKTQNVSVTVPEEMVTILYMDEVSRNSTLELPGYGSIRPMSYIEIPKKEFGGKFMGIPIARKFIDRRKLLVMDGLTKEERERWNCDYKEGEVLDERTFDKMLDFPTPKLAEIFKALCPDHQRFVACRMITAKEKGDNRISIERAKIINDLSKATDPRGMLKPVMEAYGAEITG